MILENTPLFSEINAFSVAFRIILALILGGLLGIEREQKQHPAGFRTYVIVCLGSTLACITNIYMFETLGASDPARIPAQVISGIGFLGAGTILVTRNNHVRGLTTAAGLWCCATVGIAIGSGFYLGAIVCDIVIAFSLRILTPVDRRFNRYNKYLYLYAECEQSEFVKELMRYVRINQYRIYDLEIYPATNSSACYIMFTVKLGKSSQRDNVIEDIRKFKGAMLVEEMNN